MAPILYRQPSTSSHRPGCRSSRSGQPTAIDRPECVGRSRFGDSFRCGLQECRSSCGPQEECEHGRTLWASRPVAACWYRRAAPLGNGRAAAAVRPRPLRGQRLPHPCGSRSSTIATDVASTRAHGLDRPGLVGPSCSGPRSARVGHSAPPIRRAASMRNSSTACEYR